MESSHLLNALADASVRAICLAVAAIIAIAVARTRSAPVKHAVWTAVVCAMLVLPVLSVALPAIPLRVLAPPAAQVELLPSPVSGAQPDGPLTVTATPAPDRSLPGWPAMAAFAYALVAAALLGKLALGYLLSRRLVRRSTPIEGAAVEAPGAILAESAAVSVPLTVGWRRPHILLPAGWRDWDRTKLAAVLAHEAAHVSRRDWLVAMLARLNKCVFWFHPLAWWMERKLAALAEEACDESSLLATGDRERYAQVLLEMADAVRRSDGRIAWHAVAMARRSQVRQRVEAILDESRRLSRGMTKTRWAAVLLCAAPLAYGAAALRFEQAQAPAQIEQKVPWAPGSYMDTLSRGNSLTPEQAQKLEESLQANPDDVTARGGLIAYYFVNGIREPRLKHILWLIEHHPESEITGFTSAGISPRGGALNSESDYAQARELWLEQVRTHEKDPSVLANAAKFLVRGGDPATAADLLKRVAAINRNNQWTNVLGSLYAMTIVGALRPDNSRVGELPYDPAVAERFKAELEASTDRFLRLSAASDVLSLIQRAGGGPELAPAADFAERLRKKAIAELGLPPNAEIRLGGVSGGIPGGVQGGVPGGVAPATAPDVTIRGTTYPPLAKQARIQGTVRLQAQLGADGALQRLWTVSGHPLLVPAAQDAVRQWVAEQARANRTPPKSNPVIDVNYWLPRETEPATEAAAQPPMRIRVGGNVQMANLVNKVEPVYPPLALQARIQGTVRFNIVIGPDGHVKNIQLEGGHPLLVPAAQEAVKQWEWRPTLLNGQPVEVNTVVDVPFTLPENR